MNGVKVDPSFKESWDLILSNFEVLEKIYIVLAIEPSSSYCL